MQPEVERLNDCGEDVFLVRTEVYVVSSRVVVAAAKCTGVFGCKCLGLTSIDVGGCLSVPCLSTFNHTIKPLHVTDASVFGRCLSVGWHTCSLLLILNCLNARPSTFSARIATSTEYAQTTSTFLSTITLSCLSLVVPPLSSSPCLHPFSL